MEDYLKIPDTQISRPKLSIYEYSNVLSSMAEKIFDSPNLEEFIADETINDLINPAELAFKLFNEHKYDAYLLRDNEKILFSSLYFNPNYLDLLNNYFKNQSETVDKLIVNPLINQK